MLEIVLTNMISAAVYWLAYSMLGFLLVLALMVGTTYWLLGKGPR